MELPQSITRTSVYSYTRTELLSFFLLSFCRTPQGVPGGDNFVKGVQYYELFGGIALKNHAFSFFKRIETLDIIFHAVIVHCTR